VKSDQYYVFLASHERLASPAQMRTVLRGDAVEQVNLVLQPTTRVYGRLTMGTAQSPVAKQRLSLYQREGDSYCKLPKDQRLPNPNNSTRAFYPAIVHSVMTNADGRFEIFVGPGRYYIIGPDGATPPKFEITGQKDFEVKSTTPSQRTLLCLPAYRFDLEINTPNLRRFFRMHICALHFSAAAGYSRRTMIR